MITNHRQTNRITRPTFLKHHKRAEKNPQPKSASPSLPHLQYSAPVIPAIPRREKGSVICPVMSLLRYPQPSSPARSERKPPAFLFERRTRQLDSKPARTGACRSASHAKNKVPPSKRVGSSSQRYPEALKEPWLTACPLWYFIMQEPQFALP